MEVFSIVLPWENQILMPINDIQYDGPDGVADLKRLGSHLAWGMERNALFIGLGDFIDFMSPSNRERYAGSNLYTNAKETVDRIATILEDEIMHVLSPTRGRWIGLLQGHHFFEHLDGTSSDTRFAEALDTRYLGDSVLGRIRFRDEHGAGTTIKVFAHHGGSATTANGAMTKLKAQKASYPDVRLFLNNPFIEDEDKAEVVTAIAQCGEFNQKLVNFILLIIRQDRFTYVEDIFYSFDKFVRQRRHKIEAVVESAVELSADEIEKLKGSLKNRFQREIDIKTRLNPQILAGIRVRIGDKIIDATVNNSLQLLKQSIVRG